MKPHCTKSPDGCHEYGTIIHPSQRESCRYCHEFIEPITMTPTTITRADELAKAAEALLRDEPLSEPGLANAIAAYRAARSTDGACEDSARLDWLEKNNATVYRMVDECDVTLGWKVSDGPKEWPTPRAAIDAARAASGSGETG